MKNLGIANPVRTFVLQKYNLVDKSLKTSRYQKDLSNNLVNLYLKLKYVTISRFCFSGLKTFFML